MESDNRSGSGSESVLLRSCMTFLSRRDFDVCRRLANRVTKSDPETVSQLEQMVAIVDVLAAASRLGSLSDHYAILNLNPSDAGNRDLVRQQFKKLVRLLDPNKNKFPFVDEALMRVREAWAVLSDPVQRDQFDRQIRGEKGSFRASMASFWTMCPYCWYMHEYERKYEGCTFRCENCKRTFHGTEVKAPAAESVVEGKEQYYCHHVSLPLKYPLNDGSGFEVGGKKMRVKTVANRVRVKGFVALESDDSDLEK